MLQALPLYDKLRKHEFIPLFSQPRSDPLLTEHAAAAVQMHNFARILLLVHQPAAGGYREYFVREKDLNAAIDMIVGLAMTIDYEPAEVVSTQCLFAAGLYANELFKREKICELIEKHQRNTGWPVQSLADELRTEWARARPP